ncbi:MAG: hypothetical protein DRP46_03085 [Candidatus Zixiibacteriota bacterium]|nr:MAG: hypothetical protein DRP46_03085 [candidate division Zixibacteria bacterium]HDL03819.1 cell division protein ZapB [candidate division Zixibacteria bacterium]
MDTLEKLEEKITKAVTLIERLNAEKKSLMEENGRLKEKLTKTEARLSEIEKNESERSEKMKSKLGNILDKLGTLEQF